MGAAIVGPLKWACKIVRESSRFTIQGNHWEEDKHFVPSVLYDTHMGISNNWKVSSFPVLSMAFHVLIINVVHIDTLLR